MTTYKTVEEIVEKYPSVGTREKYGKLTDKYTLVSTADVLRNLMERDFDVVAVSTQQPRKRDRASYVKHCVTLRKSGEQDHGPLGIVPQVLLTNSHDGTTSFRIQLGYFRFVCANGLVVGRETMAPIFIRHDVDNPVKYVEMGVDHTIKQAEPVYANIHRMRMTTHPDDEQSEARMAFRLLHGLRPTRDDIDGSHYNFYRQFAKPANNNDVREFNLWSLYNRVQFNMVHGRFKSHNKNGSLQRAREIKGLDRITKVNETLWDNAVELSKRFGAAA